MRLELPVAVENPTGGEAQALWDDVEKEREAGIALPLATEAPAVSADAPDTDATVEVVDAALEKPPAAETVVAVDPYAGLSPEIKAKLDRIDALERSVGTIGQLEQRFKTAEGRVTAMQRELDVAKKAATVATVAPTAAQIVAAKASTDKWDALKGDFPEWADATEQFVKAELAGLTPKQTATLTPEQVEAMVEQRMTAMRAETAKALEHARVDGKYDTWRETVNSDEFLRWHAAQTPAIQALSSSTQGRDAIRMLDLFHEAKAQPADAVAAARAAKLAAAASNKPGPSAANVTKTVDEMSPQEIWDYERKRAAKKGSERGLHY